MPDWEADDFMNLDAMRAAGVTKGNGHREAMRCDRQRSVAVTSERHPILGSLLGRRRGAFAGRDA